MGSGNRQETKGELQTIRVPGVFGSPESARLARTSTLNKTYHFDFITLSFGCLIGRQKQKAEEQIHDGHRLGLERQYGLPFVTLVRTERTTEALAIKPGIDILGAAAALEEWRASPAALEAYEAQVAELGEDLDPADPRLLERRLVPDPRKMRIRVYETDSVHKSMSSLRQGSIVAVRDEDSSQHVSAFHEAVFIHASTSPNAQIIASMDVARRQMELEGYELVMRAIETALAIRRAVAGHPVISLTGRDAIWRPKLITKLYSNTHRTILMFCTCWGRV